MDEAGLERVRHIKDAIGKIRSILAGKTYDEAVADIALWPATERYLEIISEASRKIPAAWKDDYGQDIEWRQLADLGNRLRHVYDRVQSRILWESYEHDLDPLEAAVDRMIAANTPTPSPPRSS